VKEERPTESPQIILTPVLFISFLVSLFFVNAKDRARRTAAHTPPSSYLTFLFPASWLDSEPYQDHHDSTWGRRDATGHVEPDDTIAPKDGQLDGAREASKGEAGQRKRSWHLNKKIRKMAKLEVNDAFESQGKIIMIMITMLVLSIIGFWVGMRWVWRSVFG
jgi:hypothetical protein